MQSGVPVLCSARSDSVTLVRTSLLNAIAVFIRVACALTLNKILAVFVGPAGYALIGQLQSVVSIFASLAGGVIGTGVTKGTAEHFDDEIRQRAIWRTAIRLATVSSILVGVLLLALKDPLAIWLFQRHDLADVFVWLVIALPGMGINAVLLAILNGKKEVNAFVLANIAGSLLGLLVIGGLSAAFGVRGALIAVAVNPAVSIIASAMLFVRMSWFKRQYFSGGVDRESLRSLANFAIMTLTTALCVPISHMLIRNNLGETLGWEAAGHWQAMWKVSETYLMLITMPLSVYYLPRIAEIRQGNQMKVEIAVVSKFALPIAAIAAAAIYLLRDTLVGWLFTPEFSPMSDLFGWQLGGDVVKIASFVLGYILIGRAMTKAFIVTEIVFSLTFVLLCWYFAGQFGLRGAAIAHFVNYTIYGLVMFVLVRREIVKMSRTAEPI